MDTTSMDLAREAVRRGIALLDQRGPEDWRSRVDLEALDISDGDRCILGQVYADAWRAAGKPTWQPFGHGRNILAGNVGHVWGTSGYFDFSQDHGLVDFITVIEGDSDHDDRQIIVSSDDLARAWTQALS